MHAGVRESCEGVGDGCVRLALFRCSALALVLVGTAAVTAGAGHASTVFLQVEVGCGL